MTDYKLLCSQLESFCEDEKHFLPVLSNASALIFQNMEKINWAGFYVMQKNADCSNADESLLLGPFQGKPACIRIKTGKGVCGTAVLKNETQLVKDVHKFPGHIACDSASNSEVVVPFHFSDGTVAGVLDIDSPYLERFTEEDSSGLEAFVKVLESEMDFKSLEKSFR